MSEGASPPTPSEEYAELLKEIGKVSETVKGLEERVNEREKTSEERESRKISESLNPLENRITQLETSIKNLKWAIGISVSILTLLVAVLGLLSKLGIL